MDLDPQPDQAEERERLGQGGDLALHGYVGSRRGSVNMPRSGSINIARGDRACGPAAVSLPGCPFACSRFFSARRATRRSMVYNHKYWGVRGLWILSRRGALGPT